MSSQHTDRSEEFVQLITANQQRVLVYLRSLLPAGADVDDLLQETCLVCWREFGEFRPGSNFAAWACTVAFNRVRAWRTQQVRQRLVFSESFLLSVAAELDDNAAELDNRSQALERCIQRLPGHHRELLRQRYAAEDSVEDISKRLERSIDSVYRMLSRIRAALHSCVNRSVGVEAQ